MRIAPCLLMIGVAFPAAGYAQDSTLAPISEVIRAFKAEINEAHASSPTRCKFVVEQVDFTFHAQTQIERAAGADGTFEVIGIKVGASGDQSQGEKTSSIVKVSFKPRVGRGLEEVGGAARAIEGFGALIRNTKRQIETSAEEDDSLEVLKIVVETDFRFEREAGGKLSIVVVGESTAGEMKQHNVVLTLGPASEGGC